MKELDFLKDFEGKYQIKVSYYVDIDECLSFTIMYHILINTNFFENCISEDYEIKKIEQKEYDFKWFNESFDIIDYFLCFFGKKEKIDYLELSCECDKWFKEYPKNVKKEFQELKPHFKEYFKNKNYEKS
jgi:hypothetical protein